jgi:hypothetical protein
MGCGLKLLFLGFAEQLGVARRRALGIAHERSLSAPAPSVPKRTEDDLAATWDSLSRPGAEVLRFLKKRGIARASKFCREAGPSIVGEVGKLAKKGYRLAVPLYDANGAITAIQFRAIDGRKDRFRTIGASSAGLFGDPEHLAVANSVLLTEGLTDFLAASVARDGNQNMAVFGAAGAASAAALQKLALDGRSVVIAFDADDAGDHGAQIVADGLTAAGVDCFRARPSGAKDVCGLLSNDPTLSKLLRSATPMKAHPAKAQKATSAIAGSWEEPLSLIDGKRPRFPTDAL